MSQTLITLAKWGLYWLKGGSLMNEKKMLLKTEQTKVEAEQGVVTLREILQNAIKMQALYSKGSIKFIETSAAVN